MKNPKIAIVTNSCWNVYNFRMDFIQHLRQLGFQVIVVAPIDEYIRYLDEKYFVKHIPLFHLSPHRTSIFQDLFLVKELYQIYKREKPDLIFQYTIKPNIYGSIASRFLGLHCVSTLTGLGRAYQKLPYRYFFGFMYKIALSGNRKVIFQNSDDQDLFINNKWVEASKILLIPGSGIDANKFRPSDLQKDKTKFVFLFAGRLLLDKGIREFVNAANYVHSILRNAEFWIIGEFNPGNPNSISKSELLNWIESGVIKYFGNEKDIKAFLNKSDVLVMPSYREGLSRVILEAMSMAKPVITTNVPGCRQLVTDGWNGFLVEPKEVYLLAEAMLNIFYLDDGQRSEIGMNGRKRVLEKYELNFILQMYDELISELLTGNSSFVTKGQGVFK